MLVTSVPLVSPDGLTVEPHWVRVGGVHGFGVVSPSGRVAGSPAWLQSIARLDARMPDHAWPYESVENKSNIEIRGKRCKEARLICLWPPTIAFYVVRRSLAAQRCERQTRKYDSQPLKSNGL